MDALTLHAEVDTRPRHSPLVGSDAAVPAGVVRRYPLDLQREVGGEMRTCPQADIRTATLPSQIKAHGAGHHTGQ